MKYWWTWILFGILSKIIDWYNFSPFEFKHLHLNIFGLHWVLLSKIMEILLLSKSIGLAKISTVFLMKTPYNFFCKNWHCATARPSIVKLKKKLLIWELPKHLLWLTSKDIYCTVSNIWSYFLMWFVWLLIASS